MGYLGNSPAESYASFERQVFTIVNSQTAYTLNHAVTNENDIRLVVNNVVQEPGSGKAYTASGTTLTLSAALVNGTDEMYCVFLGRALQTINPPNASVGSSQTAPTIITGQTAETSIATDDTILIHDTSASALRKMTRANFVSGIGGTNTPAFHAHSSGTQVISSETQTKVEFATELFDVGTNFASHRFTPTTAGKYYCYAIVDSSWSGSVGGNHNETHFRKNGSSLSSTYEAGSWSQFYSNSDIDIITKLFTAGLIEFNGSGDYLEVFHYSDASSPQITGCFGGYKIIE
jgi:hypothetical protein